MKQPQSPQYEEAKRLERRLRRTRFQHHRVLLLMNWKLEKMQALPVMSALPSKNKATRL